MCLAGVLLAISLAIFSPKNDSIYLDFSLGNCIFFIYSIGTLYGENFSETLKGNTLFFEIHVGGDVIPGNRYIHVGGEVRSGIPVHT